MKESNKDYLYHYTSIETLALILKNRTIRFNSLDKMDDLQEKEAEDIKNAGQFCYVSSWTEDVTESIPMWKMYATTDSGVRIGLRRNPFKLYENTVETLSKITNMSVRTEENAEALFSLIPVEEMFKKGFICPMAMSQNILHRVQYTQEYDKLYPKLVTINGEQFAIALGELGKYKNIHWEFQKEWRYMLLFFPLNFNQPIQTMSVEAQIMGNKILHGLEKQPFPYYDMTLDNEVFEDMEITMCPQISEGNRIIIKSLVDKYNQKAIVKESSLKGLI